MPHPLPEDIDSVSGLKWFLAAVPNDPAFTRAAWDVFTELTNYWKWGKEGPVPEDSDKAAQLWSSAVYETIEAYKMGFPEDLLGYIDEVEGLLRALQSVPCCDAPTVSYQGDYDPNTQSEVQDGVGDPPMTYGDDTITTWDEWADYKCEAAYFLVERAATLCEDLADIQSWDTPLNAEIIGLALGRIPVAGDIFKAAWELVWNLLELSWDSILDLETAAGEIRAADDEIACAITLADGPEAAAAAFKTAVQDAVTQTGASLVVPWLPYVMWANIIYEGSFVNAEGTTVPIDSYLTPGTNDCCVCANTITLQDDPEIISDNGSTVVLRINKVTSGTLLDDYAGSVKFHWYVAGSSYCGPEVEVTAISVSDSGDMTRIIVADQDGNTVLDAFNGSSCNQAVSQVVGLQGAEFYFERQQVSDGGCGSASFDVTITYEDVT